MCEDKNTKQPEVSSVALADAPFGVRCPHCLESSVQDRNQLVRTTRCKCGGEFVGQKNGASIVLGDDQLRRLNEFRTALSSMITAENEIINHRVTWLLVSQSLMFVAIVGTWHNSILATLIASAAAISACITWLPIVAADVAITNAADRWYEELRRTRQVAIDHPPVIGLDSRAVGKETEHPPVKLRPAAPNAWVLLPQLFFGFWVLVLLLQALPAFDSLKLEHVIAMIAGPVCCLIAYWTRKHSKALSGGIADLVLDRSPIPGLALLVYVRYAVELIYSTD